MNLMLSENTCNGGWLAGTLVDREVNNGNIIITPFLKECLNPNSYNYHLDKYLKRLTSAVLDCKIEDEYEDITIPKEGYILQPGECYLGSTKEIFGSNIYAALITGRSSVGRKFITNHVTAGLIDQGFLGKITLEITVQKPTKIYRFMRFGQIFWFTVFGNAELYTGKYQNQSHPTTSRLHCDYQKDGKII
ncbi:MAG: dCTP deaminase [Candidatus Electrothrix communis]|nr:MAG: dCTP deaminase [Candidatus Electrothrix communis]